MTPQETTQLVAFLAARCPAMKIEPGTTKAWHLDLEQIRLDQALQAARRLTARRPFVSLAELLDEVRVIRLENLERTPVPAPPAELADVPIKAIEWQKEWTRRIADGDVPPEYPALKDYSEPLQRALTGVFHEVPRV